MQVSVIVPTFNRPEALAATLAALSDLKFPPEDHEIIVVDDAPDAESRDVVEAAGAVGSATVRYAPQPNSGVATARNHGARLARGEVLLFLDDDMIVEPGHIQQHLAAHGSQPNSLVNGHWEFAPSVRASLETTPFGQFRMGVERWVKKGIEKEPLELGRLAPSAVTACNLSIERERFWELGGFDESFPLAGFEDQEFSYRAGLAGLKFVYDPEIRLLHNDNRLTLKQFCLRQERGAQTAVYMASKHRGAFGDGPMIVENGPVLPRDSPRLVVKKILKAALSRRPILTAGHAGLRLLERVAPQSRLVCRAYWGMCGLYIFKGVRKGFETAPEELRTELRASTG